MKSITSPFTSSFDMTNLFLPPISRLVFCIAYGMLFGHIGFGFLGDILGKYLSEMYAHVGKMKNYIEFVLAFILSS